MQVNYDASASDIRTALQGISGMPTGIVRVSRSDPDHNNLFFWKITFETLRGNAGSLVANALGLLGTVGVAYDNTSSTFITYPSLAITEAVPGTYISGTFDIMLDSTHQTTVSMDASELDMRIAVDSLFASAGYSISTKTSIVSRIGPNRAGAYQWHIVVADDNSETEIPLLAVNGDQLQCGATCQKPNITVIPVSKRERAWKQQLKLEASHSYETQYITVTSSARVSEVQTLQIFATRGYIHLSLDSYSVDDRIDILPTETFAQRVEFAIETLVGVNDVDVSITILPDTTMNVVVTFIQWNGDVPTIGMNDSALIYENFDNGIFIGTTLSLLNCQR